MAGLRVQDFTGDKCEVRALGRTFLQQMLPLLDVTELYLVEREKRGVFILNILFLKLSGKLMVAETKPIYKFMLRPQYRYLYESNPEFAVL